MGSLWGLPQGEGACHLLELGDGVPGGGGVDLSALVNPFSDKVYQPNGRGALHGHLKLLESLSF